MRQFNISDLNTGTGKLRCNVRNTKKPLNYDVEYINLGLFNSCRFSFNIYYVVVMDL